MSNNLQKTPFYELHQQAGAKLVPFAGFSMPVQYALGIKKEHLHTRAEAGLFDVSHMGQVRLTGKNVKEKLEKLVPVDIIDLPLMKQRYALFTNEQGGVLDDFMVVNIGEDELFLVVNAACKEADVAHLKANLADCEVSLFTDKALLALQGPKAREVMAKISSTAAEMTFMSAENLTLNGIECFVTCSGYTGEDGYEISVDNKNAVALAEALLAFSEVEWIGLGARDSLRLEAGLCLYGHELSAEISPIEAGIRWAISKARRADEVRAGGYQGAEVIMSQMANGTEFKKLALISQGKAPVRDGSILVDENDQQIGIVTSGGYSPSLSVPIALGRVATKYAKSHVFALVRNKKIAMMVVDLPFVQQKYYRGI